MPTSQYGQVGSQQSQDGSIIAMRLGKLGDTIVSELQARYFELAYRGQLFSLSVATAAAITAYTGGAAGTPQIAVWNPAGSGKNLVPISVSYANAVAASAAGTAAWGVYYGPTAAITQATTSAPLNMGTLLASGSVATGFKNVALTSSTALSNVILAGTYYWATAAGAALVTQASEIEIAGKFIVPPGNMFALGGSAALTSATWIGSVIWAEVPL